MAFSDYDEFLELSVTDSGIGIAQDDMGKLFQAFKQIDSSLARKFEGTGLGLAMVKQLAELHSGTAAVASAVGEGAIFAVWLPWR
jgi:signal transduction histidine kinase